MHRLRVAASCIAFAFSLQSCDGNPLGPSELRELNAARLRWRDAGLTSYAIEVKQICFCGVAFPYYTRIVVNDGIVISAEPANGSVEPYPIDLTYWPTVEQVFERIVSSRNSETYKRVTADYDGRYGYPTHADFRCPENYLDCGTIYELRNLVPLRR